MQSHHTVSNDARRSAERVRLIDVPNMPLETALPLISTMPEWCGEAIAKMCSSQIGNRQSS